MKKIMTVLSLVVLTGCTLPYPIVVDFSNREVVFGEKEIQLSVGNGKDMIINLLGNPDKIDVLNDGSKYEYLNKRMSSQSDKYANYYLFLDKDNNLVSAKREIVNKK